MLNGQRNGRSNHAQSAEQAQPSVGAAPSLSLPKGGGAIRGIGEKFAANPVTGTGSITVPLAISPGRSGFAPQLALSYDSVPADATFAPDGARCGKRPRIAAVFHLKATRTTLI